MLLRPQSLGGQSSYIMIRGSSMLPTYTTGDLVITHRALSYQIGDIVAYRVPAGDFGEGIVVIHRIIGGSADKGFVIQGDNNPFKDDWSPKPADIVGKAWIRLPRVGLVLGFLHAPVPSACLAAATVIVFVLFPKKKERSEDAAVDPVPASDPVQVSVRARPRVRTVPRQSLLAVVPCTVHSRVATVAAVETLTRTPHADDLFRAA
jgi:signal peptidase